MTKKKAIKVEETKPVVPVIDEHSEPFDPNDNDWNDTELDDNDELIETQNRIKRKLLDVIEDAIDNDNNTQVVADTIGNYTMFLQALDLEICMTERMLHVDETCECCHDHDDNPENEG